MNNREFEEIEDIIDDENNFEVKPETESSVPLYEAPSVGDYEQSNGEEVKPVEPQPNYETVEPTVDYAVNDVQEQSNVGEVKPVEPQPNYETVESFVDSKVLGEKNNISEEVNEHPMAKVELNNKPEEETNQKFNKDEFKSEVIDNNILKNKSLIFAGIIFLVLLAAVFVLPILISKFMY